MRKLNLYQLYFTVIAIIFCSKIVVAQDSLTTKNQDVFVMVDTDTLPDPTVTINQDPRIAKLVAIKSQMDKEGLLTDNYKIQLYYGDVLTEANRILNEAQTAFPQWKSDLIWETPNFKVWIGDYRRQIDADRALREIKNEFSSAFILKPE